MPYRYRLLILLLICYPVLFVGQQLIFNNTGNQLRLPSQECYNVIQDAKGYVWISTENGLCRYNGNTIKVFNKNNGLRGPSVFFMKAQANGNIHAITSNQRILHINGDSIAEEKYADAFVKKVGGLNETVYDMQESENDYIINTYLRTFKINRKNSSITDLQAENPYKTDADLIIILKPKGTYIIKNKGISYPGPENKKDLLKITVIKGNAQKNIIIPWKDKIHTDKRIRLCEINGTVFFNFQNKLISVNQAMEHTIVDQPSRIIGLYTDRRNGLWVGLFQKGLNYYKDIHNMSNVTSALPDYSVTGMLMDREGAIWCTTLEKNVFYCNSLHALTYANIPQLKKMTTLLKCVQEKVFISTGHDNLFSVDNSIVKDIKTDTDHNADYTDVFIHHHKRYISNKQYTYYTEGKSLKKNFINCDGINWNAYNIDSSGNKLYAVSFRGLYEIKGNNAFLIKDLNAVAIKSLVCYDTTTFYIGDKNGLLKFNSQTCSEERIKEISMPVTKLLRAQDGRLWIATKGDGLFVMENKHLTKIDFGNHPPGIFFDVEEDNEHTIWASSETGLISIGHKGGKELTRVYNTSNGLLSDDIRQLAINGHTIYVSTIEGLCSIVINNEIINSVAPVIYTSSFKVNNEPVSPDQLRQLNLPYDQNSIHITFDVLSFKTGDYDLLFYQLPGKDTTWRSGRKNELTFDNLPPGDYKLTAYGINNDGVKSAKPVIITFTIQKPLWLRFWFILTCLLLSTVIVCLVVLKIIKRVRLKENEKNRVNKLILQSRLSALQAQMNPHFIFNAISSIQNYILKNDEKEAYNYLAKFGKLIRMILNNSRENTLTLCQELETLDLYIQLEKLRFKNSFDYELKVHNDIDKYSVYLPTMLMQPYIENAIWHGLMNLNAERKGLLLLTVSKKNDLLEIIIEDNGIGRVRSEEYKKDAIHHSIGMKLTEQRLRTISELNGYEGIRISIIDLYDPSGKASGTRVQLFLPFIT